MKPLCTASLLLGLTVSMMALTGCTGQTDNVYSPDEQRGRVGAVARDEVGFPLSVGTAVPDANGNATTLTSTMQGVRVRFLDFAVNGTCDNDTRGDGEFYYDLGINGRVVARRDVDHSHALAEGEAVSLDGTRVFFVDPDETFTINVTISEDDDFLNVGDDYVGSRQARYTARDLEAGDIRRSVQVGGGNCEVVVSYDLERVQ